MISIVVLTYNQLDTCTKACIESIYKFSEPDEFELIVVDNDSSDGTKEYLRNIETKHSNMTVILNDTNKGYSGGNNDGIKASKGEFVILLNNDTLVSDGWLKKMRYPFLNDKQIGLVGPISNSVGNEQRVNIKGLNNKNYNEKIAKYTSDNKDVVTYTQRLGFFCVAIKKEVIDNIGLLDEKFGIGMFEDDDYCMRATKESYKLAVTDGCFIFHKGSVSFKKLTTDTYQEIFSKNKDYFLQKHAVEWSLSDISFAYWDKFNQDLIDYQNTGNKSAINRIIVRFENFNHLLFQVREVELKKSNITSSAPNQSISKTKWKMRLDNIKQEFIFGSFYDKKRYTKKIFNRLIKSSSVGDSTEICVLKEIKLLAGSNKVIVFPPTIDYGYMKQRPQHLADEFAQKGYFVIYTTLNHTVDNVTLYDTVNSNLILLNGSLLTDLHHVFHKKDVTYYCLWPNNQKFMAHIPYSYLIYDYMDELKLLDLDQREVIDSHNYLLGKADLITVSAKKLYESIPCQYKDKTLLLKNAVDNKFIHDVNLVYKIPNEIRLCQSNYDKVIGYYGVIAPWIDFDLIEYSLQKLPTYSFVFIGPVFDVEDKINHLKDTYDNIFFLKEMKRESLIPYLNSFDICSIPFVNNNITNSVSPVKIYEYIAANKPVVTTNILECQDIQIVDVVSSKEEFVAKLRSPKAIASKESFEFIEDNLWSNRVEAILKNTGKEKINE